MTYDCQSCGACCVSPFEGEGYIQVAEGEEMRLTHLGLPVLEIIPGAAEDRVAMLGTRLNSQRVRVCAGLFGKIGRRCACAVYDARPSLCREFEAGTPECLQARKAAGVD